MKITYQFTDQGDLDETFNVQFTEDMQLISTSADATLPEWTRLAFHQCGNCPLQSTPRCPAAVVVADLMGLCEQLISYDKVEVKVTTEGRTIIQKTSAQRGISALMGLLLATNGCPVTAIFRPMARFHLPFSSEEETVYRVTSMFALAQYFLAENNIDSNLADLSDTYKEIQQVNRAMADRLRSAATTDSSINALVLLDTLGMAVPSYIDQSLDELRELFEPCLKALADDPHIRSRSMALNYSVVVNER